MTYQRLLTILGALGLVAACTNTGFTGTAKHKGGKNGGGNPGKGTGDDDDTDNANGSDGVDADSDDAVPKGVVPGKPNPDVDGGDGEPIRIFDEDFPGVILVKPLQPVQKQFFWTVTVDGKVTFYRLEKHQITERKNWTGAVGGPGGARTYVIEGGSLVVARSGGHLFFIDPENTPEGPLAKTAPTYFKLDGPANDDRGCVVSYKRDKKRFLGIGYGPGKFVEFAMENSGRFTPKWNDVTGQVQANSNKWGYSCYIDQGQLVYYSQWASSKSAAVNLKTMKAVAPEQTAPNAGFKSTTLPQATIGTGDAGSYAMNGDREGDVLNGQGFYTMGYEPLTRTVWGAAGGMMNVIPSKCLTDEATCTGHSGFNMAQMNAIVGPISALGDGAMIGLMRGQGQAYLMTLKDKKNIAKGIDVTRLTDIPGDPYMYTDFTGATLYLTKTENTFDLGEVNDFDSATANKAIGFAWVQRKDESKTWEDLKLEVRCYKSGGEPGDYEEVANVKDAMEQTITTKGGCGSKKYDTVDVRITQLNDASTLMQIKKVQITAYQ